MKNKLKLTLPIIGPHRPANANRHLHAERVIAYGVRPFAVDHRPGAETSIGRKSLYTQNHTFGTAAKHAEINSMLRKIFVPPWLKRHEPKIDEIGPKSSQVQPSPGKIFSRCGAKTGNLQPSTQPSASNQKSSKNARNQTKSKRI